VKIRIGLLLLIIGVLATAYVGFFMVTARLSSPASMELYIPKDENDRINYKSTLPRLNLVLLKNDMVYSYYDNDFQNGKSFSYQDIRNVIIERINRFSKDSLVVIIKPMKDATYKNTVDILDEMTRNGIESYTMVDVSKEEKKFFAKVE
jgi:biopolymer transport protein ExbD